MGVKCRIPSNAASKILDVAIRDSIDGPVVSFDGFINENVRFDQLPIAPASNLIFDLAGVALINSLGIRGWVTWMRSMRAKSFIFRRCSKAVVDQINILEGFLPPGSVVESFLVPYHCDACQKGEMILFRQGHEFEKGTPDHPEKITPPGDVECPICRTRMEMDVIETKYFRFLKYRR